MSTQDQDLHQVILRWPHTDANEVIVTGTFDQWSSSLHLSRKPDGFEAPVFIPWKDKIMYKFIVDGRWMTNDAEPTEIDHGFVNNVYTAPSKPPLPEPQHAVVPNESEVEPEHVEQVPRHADKPVVNGSALGEPHEAPVPIAGPVPAAPEKPSAIPDEVKQVVTSAVDAPHAATAHVAPEPQEVERASEEVAPDQAPKEPVHIVLADAAEAEEPASASVPEPEPGTTPDVDAAGVDGSVPVEKGTSPTAEAESKVVAEEPAPVPEPEPVAAVAVEPVPEPTKFKAAPAAESETVQTPEHEVPVAPVHEESAAVPQPSVPTPAVERDSEPGKRTGPTPGAEPAVAAAAAPEPKPDVKSSEAPSSPSPTVPAVRGHTKTASTASASTAAPTLPTTPSRRASRKFSFPGWDKSGNSSPTGSSRISSHQKREKRHSLLGKLKEIFGDKEKKERKEKSAKA